MALRKRRPGLVYPVREDWHYVGEAGEPAFGTNWANAASDRNLAFRIREMGVVDIQGCSRALNRWHVTDAIRRRLDIIEQIECEP